MLRIVVTQYNGQPPERPIAAEFDELGGKIGRGNDNALILPDIQRYISRTHALVFFRAGTYFIRDVGSASPVFVNQRQLDTGQEAPIRDGDDIVIAGYLLRVVDVRSKSAHGWPADEAVAAGSGTVKDDPLAALGTGASQSSPFSNLIPPSQPSRSAGNLAPNPPQAQAGWRDPDRPVLPAKPGPRLPPRPISDLPPSQIPDDFDPFAEPSPAPSAEHAPLPEGFDLGLGSTGPSQKIDDLFGLGRGNDHDPFAPDTPMAESLDAGGGGAPLDPLVAMGMAPAAKPVAMQPQRDNTPELYGAYRMPRPNVDAPTPGSPASGAPAPNERNRTPPVADAQRKPDLAVDRGAERPEIRRAASTSPTANATNSAQSDVGAVSAAARQNFESTPVEVRGTPASEINQLRAGAAPLSPPLPAANAIDGRSADALLQAFLAGAGVPDVHIPGGMTPQLMNMLGQLFRESTQGTLDLLLARAATKRQLRAEMTMIVAHENNPLKFSPSVEGALTHLLAPQGRGFMTPLRAIRDAYNDLRSHEVGFLAGMRAALAGVLARFSPSQLEKRLTRKGVFDALVPMNRQAKLWALFEELYADISSEAEDNFHNLFGREFMRAYEDQITKLDQEERKSKG